MPTTITTSLGVQITPQATGNPQSLITVGNLSFVATVLLYDPQFAVYASSFGTPNLVPFFSDKSAKITNNAVIVYVRNLDTTLPLGFVGYNPSNGGTVLPTGAFAIAPQGFFMFFNPANVATVTGGTPDAVGFGANPTTVSPIAPTTLQLVINSQNVATNRIVYAEILVAS